MTSPKPKTKLRPGTQLAPVPAVLVSCGAKGRRPNIISIAWVGTVCSEPPMVAIGVRPSRHSHDLIREAGDFVVNLPSAAQAEWVSYCGTHSGRDTDKFAALGLTAAAGDAVSSPLIAECPVNLECKVTKIIALGSHDLFLGEVVAASADPSVVSPAGSIDPVAAGLISYAGGAYWSLGQAVLRR
jgi:flavin reductase (DIM6/NTAB) family NADH-FMN oxidoreductase RutF